MPPRQYSPSIGNSSTLLKKESKYDNVNSKYNNGNNMTMLIGHENENIQTASIQNTNNENLQSANDSVVDAL